MNYDSPFMKMLETVANMLIISFLWLLFSLPILTLVPSSAALFHTVRAVIFGPGRGNGILKDFVSSFRENLVTGLKLSLISIAVILIVAEGLWTGYQIWRINIWGMLYMILGIVLSFVLIPMLLFIPPALSRFDAGVGTILRIAAYLAMKKPLRSILFTVLLYFMVSCVQLIPLAIVIVPALYTDLIRPSTMKDLDELAATYSVPEEEDEEEEETEEETGSNVDLDRELREEERKR